jgi:hypothetical protein
MRSRAAVAARGRHEEIAECRECIGHEQSATDQLGASGFGRRREHARQF